MKNKASALFTWFFVLCLVTVPVIQVKYEIKTASRVQFLDFFNDIFVTPFKYSKNVNEIYQELLNGIDQLKKAQATSDTGENSEASGDISVQLEEVLAKAEELKRAMINVNRHIVDSGQTIVSLTDSIISQINNLSSTGVAIPPTQIDKLQTESVALKNHLPDNVVFLAIKHLFAYSLFNTRYVRAYEKDVEQSSSVARSIRDQTLITRYALLKDFGDKAIRGINGWLFYKPGIQYLYDPPVVTYNTHLNKTITEPGQDNPLDAILDFKHQLDSIGIDLLVVIVPGKPSIYPDLINPRLKPSHYIDKLPSVRFIDILRKNDINAIDLFHPFIAERQNDSLYGDSLYLKTDTHWKNRAPRLAASIVADEIKKQSWFYKNKRVIEYGLDTIYVTRTGDIGQMTKLPDIKSPLLKVTFSSEQAKCYKVFKLERDESGAIVDKIPYKDDFKHSRILLLGDSFSRIYQTDAPRSAGWISHLAYELKEPLASIISDGGASTIVRQTLAKKASLLKGKKLVVWEFIERDLRFGSEGWKNITLPVV
ncbi:MAG: hypothetical protein GX640_02975, partial [Fibrobacter sp.]|nr:hypothetical protein [Fibrobacter sp.]